MDSWKNAFILQEKKTSVHKIPRFRGGDFGFSGGGSADFIFMGARIFLKRGPEFAQNTMGPEMITQIIRKQFFCVTDVCVIGKLIPRQLMCVIGASTESTLCKRPITQKNSCPNALCNRCPV